MEYLESLKQRVVDQVETWRGRLIQTANTIHANPEVAFQEFESAALLSSILEAEGFTVKRGIGGLETAFVAALNGRAGSPIVALLAEYDALPELGHACGHNLIGTSAVGAALAMKAIMPELSGAIQVIGTPAEEGGGGKVILVKAGVFDSVQAAMMVHPSTYNVTRRRSLTSHRVVIEFHGKAAHAAGSPDLGINALDGLIQTFNGVNALRQHLLPSARIHGIITHGGQATNIVPDYARGVFGFRAADLAYANRILDRLRACAEAGALASGAQLTFTEPAYYYDAMLPNEKLADLMDANMAALGIEVRPPRANERMGSSDMGNVSQVVPALHPYLAIGPEDIAGHSTEFRELSASPVGHEAMINAAKAMAMTAVDLLALPENMAEVKRSFERHKSA